MLSQLSKKLVKDLNNSVSSIKRCQSTSIEDSLQHSQYVYNRNPRNLEKLRIAYKPAGYHLEKPGREFWHKFVFKFIFRY